MFIIDNYDRSVDVRSPLNNVNFKAKRSVWKYKREKGTCQIRGYIEILRSVRLCFVERIFPNAHWDAAQACALDNYEYCIKGGVYDSVGDFFNLLKKINGKRSNRALVPLTLRGLMDTTADQSEII